MSEASDARQIERLVAALGERQEELVARAFEYARAYGYAKHMSPDPDVYRLSVRILSQGLTEFVASPRASMDWRADDVLPSDVGSEIGSRLAESLRRYGATPAMALGMLKYFRRAFGDIARAGSEDPELVNAWMTDITHFFDHVELGYVAPFADLTRDDVTSALRERNRELVAEKNLYQVAFEYLPIPVFMLDAHGSVQSVNSAGEALFGEMPATWPVFHLGARTLGEPPVLGEEISDFVSCPDRERTVDRELKTSKGTRFFQVRLTKLFESSGSLSGVLVALTDLTYRRRAEEALRGSEARYRLLWQSSVAALAFMDVVLDRRNRPVDLKFIEVNEAFVKMARMADGNVNGTELKEHADAPVLQALSDLAEVAGAVAITGQTQHAKCEVPSLGLSLDVRFTCPKPGQVVVALFEPGQSLPAN